MFSVASHALLALVMASGLSLSGQDPRALSLPTQMLAIHNRERALVHVPPLAWSDRLAADAAAYARQLVQMGELDHSSEASRGDEGENLAMGTAGYYSPAALGMMWADEKRHLTGGAFGADSRTGNWEDVGHYTQMVWRGTRQVGCATASGGGDLYLICRYAPAGNYIGDRVY